MQLTLWSLQLPSASQYLGNSCLKCCPCDSHIAAAGAAVLLVWHADAFVKVDDNAHVCALSSQ